MTSTMVFIISLFNARSSWISVEPAVLVEVYVNVNGDVTEGDCNGLELIETTTGEKACLWTDARSFCFFVFFGILSSWG